MQERGLQQPAVQIISIGAANGNTARSGGRPEHLSHCFHSFGQLRSIRLRRLAAAEPLSRRALHGMLTSEWVSTMEGYYLHELILKELDPVVPIYPVSVPGIADPAHRTAIR